MLDASTQLPLALPTIAMGLTRSQLLQVQSLGDLGQAIKKALDIMGLYIQWMERLLVKKITTHVKIPRVPDVVVVVNDRVKRLIGI